MTVRNRVPSLDANLVVSTNEDQTYGEDLCCDVECVCGVNLSIYSDPQTCSNCGRIYWTDFVVYRMETKAQHREWLDTFSKYPIGKTDE